MLQIFSLTRLCQLAHGTRLTAAHALMEILAGPLRRRSKFAVSTARREIHGDPLHRTALPPTLLGFFYRVGGSGEDSDEEEEEEAAEREGLPPPRQAYRQFGSLFAAPRVDPSFSFLAKAMRCRNGNHHAFLLDSCNGLLLFGHIPDVHMPDLCFIVCNPATEQWAVVPRCEWIGEDPTAVASFTAHTYLVFDPAVSSHFHLVLLWDDGVRNGVETTSAHAYSSETGAWRHSETDWSEEERRGPWEGWRSRECSARSSINASPSALVNGMLYLILGGNRVLKVDAGGRTRGIIPAPPVVVPAHAIAGNHVLFVAQSQGRLHCIVEEGDDEELEIAAPNLSGHFYYKMWRSHGLSIWVLRDSDDTQEWVLKHRVSYLQLFGKTSCVCRADYRVVTMHPDCNLVFFVRHWDLQMISYDIDCQEVRPLHTFQHNRLATLTPYVPYLSELFLGVIGAHK